MSLKLVNLVFKIGSLLALTPAKIEKNGLVFPTKAYSLLWAVLFSGALSITAIFRKASYEKLSPVVLFIQVAADTVLFILNISTIIITARKKQQWNSLIKILKTVSNRNDKGDIFWFSPFLVANLAFVTIVTYETFVWTQIMGAEFFKLYAVEYFQMYAQFIVYYLIYVFLNSILEGFQHLSKTMCKYLKLPNRSNNFSLKKIRSEFCALAIFVDVFNDIFGWLILQSIGFTFLQLLSYMQHLIVGTGHTIPTLIYRLSFITWYMVGTFNSVFICDLIEQKVKNIQMLVYQNEAEEVKILLDVINHFPHFTAARFFDLNRKTILGVLNALFTFLIVVVQFENLTS
ncbi:gustatory receptor candidate 5 [Tribolium castaneum]|uniref:Gustatory receptor n=1 Tax=Tribolium castaneum TaxID=7070 RepID=B8PUL2_TRICA|nr:gustatory receptor candidate 5 [Tribolium castaneum]ABY40583.1 gustatory receptor [Tribolium castaneum]|eukprot:XP_008195080.1 PREDICTED: gustatory receptor candidate 5 [Tribolium castaneum]